jgi:hypothetical protein
MSRAERDHALGSVMVLDVPLGVKVIVFEEWRSATRHGTAEAHLLPEESTNISGRDSRECIYHPSMLPRTSKVRHGEVFARTERRPHLFVAYDTAAAPKHSTYSRD